MDKDTNTTWVIIPTYNEESVIEHTIAQVFQYVDNIIVVDDASTDKTFQHALKTTAHVLHHSINLGQGASLQTGIEYALKNGAQYIVTFDADGQHNASEIKLMLSALKQNKAEIVLGSRFLGKTLNMSLYRKIILKISILFTYLTSGVKFSDVHNGFKVMTRKFCTQFQFTQNRMAHASEILYFIAKNKIPYIEFPVTITYTQYSIQKGQKNTGAFKIIIELIIKYILK